MKEGFVRDLSVSTVAEEGSAERQRSLAGAISDMVGHLRPQPGQALAGSFPEDPSASILSRCHIPSSEFVFFERVVREGSSSSFRAVGVNGGCVL
jgi:hypothetical protein